MMGKCNELDDYTVDREYLNRASYTPEKPVLIRLPLSDAKREMYMSIDGNIFIQGLIYEPDFIKSYRFIITCNAAEYFRAYSDLKEAEAAYNELIDKFEII